MSLHKWSQAILFLSMLLILSSCQQVEEAKVDIKVDTDATYTNPFQLPDEWSDYGLGDPYVLRHNGMYYLYVSTKDNRPGIKGWSSEDLVYWKYEGLVTEDERTTSAYAPEVVYWNGMFYMYTSPAGNGHYVLSSDSPTGPFEIKTENLGMTIDGSVFIDDDGSWYFTRAGDKGIVGHQMKDPFTFEFPINTNLFLGHWTEGSMIIKKNDRYYMTYTGNHVFSKGYRINYAVSEKNPLSGYEIPDHNPIIINTTDDFVGLGHNSIVMGPNLDSYYVVYHNLVGSSAEGPPVRQMNIDRFVFNGKKMDVLGPTNYAVPNPERPDYEQRWTNEHQPTFNKLSNSEEALFLSGSSTETYFTAEFNFSLINPIENARFKILFSYEDESNYGYASINQKEKEIEVFQVSEGIEQLMDSNSFPEEFDFTKLHTVRVENKETETVIFLDGMKKVVVSESGFGNGEIGYVIENVEVNIGYTAFSNHVDSSSDFEVYKPIPGTIEAVHYLEEEKRGFYVKEQTEKNVYRSKVPIQLLDSGAYSVSLHNKGDWLKYKVNVKESGLYGVSAIINPKSFKKNAKIEMSIDDEKPVKAKVSKADLVEESTLMKVSLGTIDLKEGFHVFKFLLDGGEIEFEQLEFYKVTEEEEEIKNGLKNIKVEDIHGNWTGSDGILISNSGEDMKLYTGDTSWSDMDVELTFEITNNLMSEAGLLFRVTNESTHPHQVQDSLMGYYVSVNGRNITLKKLNYDTTILTSESADIEFGKEQRLRVKVVKNKIDVFLNGEKNPIISYEDPNAFMVGKVGVRSEYSEVNFKNLLIRTLK
nr:family 43 glycosylhydrolase [Paenibacillus bovis]